jgi:hypothetical protein
VLSNDRTFPSNNKVLYLALLVYVHLAYFGLGQNTYLSIALYSPSGLYDPGEQITQVGYCVCFTRSWPL